jgi:hypothetical protein
LQSVERHILRNCVYLHAIESGESIPIGTQDARLLDVRFYDTDDDLFIDEENEVDDDSESIVNGLRIAADFRQRAAEVYTAYAGPLKRRFRWLHANHFLPQLANDLQADVKCLLDVLEQCGQWDPDRDAKLDKLCQLIRDDHPGEKIIIFSQFADTVSYLVSQLEDRGIQRIAAVTGDINNPTQIAWQFSPESNGKRGQISPDREIDVLIATNLLSEGQNLQDAALVVNYDLPWAIIRLIQRAGRVDRIGQKAEEIRCYSFLPADGVERIIRLRARVWQRLQENAEVVGTDEAFFEDDQNDQAIRDLFTEMDGILDGDADTEVDLSSYAFQIWHDAIVSDPSLQKIIADMPNVIYSTKPHTPTAREPEGVLVYARTAAGHDTLVWLDRHGNNITESQFAILRAATCKPDTPALARHDNHHDLVRQGIELIAAEEKLAGGQLGRPSGARFRTYERLKRYADDIKGTLFDTQQLRRAIEDIYHYPLRQVAIDILNRQLRSGISDDNLAQRVMELRDEGRLCNIHEEEASQEPRIICSMGLAHQNGEGNA